MTGRATPKREPKPFLPAPEPEDIDEDPMPEWECEGRCEYCLAYLPADGLCRCPDAAEGVRICPRCARIGGSFYRFCGYCGWDFDRFARCSTESTRMDDEWADDMERRDKQEMAEREAAGEWPFDARSTETPRNDVRDG